MEETITFVNTMLSMGTLNASCENAINEAIRDMLFTSYTYIAIYAYLDRANVGLKGFAKFFKNLSDRERDDALKLMKYLNTRGARVKIYPIADPVSEFSDLWTGEDAYRAMELALWMEKTAYLKLQSLALVASQQCDPEMLGHIEREFLTEKGKAISKIQEYVTQLAMVGGVGVWNIDQKLLNEG